MEVLWLLHNYSIRKVIFDFKYNNIDISLIYNFPSAVLLWLIYFTVNFFRVGSCQMLSADGTKYRKEWSWKREEDIINTVNKATDSQALSLLALCFLPGNIAGYIQIFRWGYDNNWKMA